MTLMWAPVSFSKSGARRWSGSATCGPLNVSRLTLRPLKACDAAGLGAAAWDADAAALGAVDAAGAVLGGALATGAELGDAGLQPAMTSINPTTGAMDLNRDTGVPPLDQTLVRPAY